MLTNLPQINRLAEKQGYYTAAVSVCLAMAISFRTMTLYWKSATVGCVISQKQHLAEDQDLTEEQTDFYQAVIITMDAALHYCKRFSLLAKKRRKNRRC